MNTESPRENNSTASPQQGTGWILLGILLLALFVRAYGVWEESYWWDEFTSIVHLSPPAAWENAPAYERWNQTVDRETAQGLLGFWQANRSMDPATMPLYYTLEYFWNQYVSRDYASLRILSIVIGLLLIPAIYLFGRTLFGRTAGLVAAFCVALSPMHWQFAQEIRMYGLMTLIALLSCWTFYRLTYRRVERLLPRTLTAAGVLLLFYALAFVILVAALITGALPLDRDGIAVYTAAAAMLAVVGLAVTVFTDKAARPLWLHALVNLLLFWTHPFAVLVPLVQGVFWLCFHPREFKRLAGWSVLNGALLAPTAAYLMTIRFWGRASTQDWMRVPGMREFMGDLLGDDLVSMTWQFAPLHGVWPPMEAFWRGLLPDSAAAWVVSWAPAVGRVMMVVFVVAAVALCMMAFRRRKQEAQPAATGGPARWTWAFFLLIWWLLPALTLMAVSLAWRPCVMPRYTIHSTLALYLILGGVIAMVRWRSLRTLLVVLVVVVFAYQHSLVFAGPRHPDYRGAARLLRAEARPCDLVLVHNSLWKRVFAFNMGPAPYVTSYADTFPTLADQCLFYLNLERPAPDAPGAQCGVWAVIRKDYFQTGPSIAFDQALEARGLVARRMEFGGIQHVLVYHVSRGPDVAPLEESTTDLDDQAPIVYGDLSLAFWRAEQYDLAVEAAARAVALDPRYGRGWSYMGMAYKEMGARQEAIRAFRKAVTIDAAGYPWDLVNLGNLLAESGRLNDALTVLHQARELLPGDCWTHASLGRVYALRGDQEQAIAFLERAVVLDPDDARPQLLLDAVHAGESVEDVL